MKVFGVSLGFAPARVLAASLEQVYETAGIEFQHLLLDNQYPIHKKRNQIMVEAICKGYGIDYYTTGKNLGLQRGYNLLFQNIESTKFGNDEDIVIGLDPDVYPVTQGWAKALVDVLQDKSVSWASLTTRHTVREMGERGGCDMEQINGVRCYIPRMACLNSICAWRLGTLKQLGGLKEPNEWYGGIECFMHENVTRLGRWVYLRDFLEAQPDCILSDKIYTKYKWELAHERSTKLDFESWIKEQNL